MKIILLALLLFPLNAFACNGYVIAFKGLNDAFDFKAFKEYTEQAGLCGKTYSWTNVQGATKFILSSELPYELYGYSQGAESVRNFLKNTALRKPTFVITVGAYKTANVNFDDFNVNYINFFDDSGKEQKNSGIFLKVPHHKIQQEANKWLFNLKK